MNIRDRLKEPSTAAGAAALLVAAGQVAGVHLPSEIAEETIAGLGAGDWVLTLGALAAGAAAILAREKGSPSG